MLPILSIGGLRNEHLQLNMTTIEKLQELKIPPNTDPSQIIDLLIIKSANQWIEVAYKRADMESLLD